MSSAIGRVGRTIDAMVKRGHRPTSDGQSNADQFFIGQRDRLPLNQIRIVGKSTTQASGSNRVR